MINPSCVISNSAQIDPSSNIGPYCIIGDNVTFAPSVKCNGNIIIEDNVYIGTGAIIKQGKSNNPIILGANSIISAGSFVTRNVQESTTVYGNPAKILSKSSIK